MVCSSVNRGHGRKILVAPYTGPLDLMLGKRIVVIADEQNLRLGARDLGYRVMWHRLRETLACAAPACEFHAVAAAPVNGCRRLREIANDGWRIWPKTVRYTHRGIEANADHLVAFCAGSVASAIDVEWFLIATGDGALGEDVAEAILYRRSACEIATLSLPGSTARRLKARRSRVIAANITIGEDCLERLV